MKMRIRVNNATVWQTKMLLPFIRRIAREEFTDTGNHRTLLTVHIVYNRGGKHRNYCSGEAYLNSSWSKIRVPYPHPGKVFPVIDFCHVLGHEFGHNRGLKHEAMGWQHGNSCRRGSYSGSHYDWAKSLPVPVPKAKPKALSTDERRAKELKTALAAVARWQSKVKLAQTKFKLWTRRVRTLEKRIAASAAAPEPLVLAATGPGEVTGG